VVDYHHAVADVIGGLFLGSTLGLLFILKAIPSLKFIDFYLPENREDIPMTQATSDMATQQGFGAPHGLMGGAGGAAPVPGYKADTYNGTPFTTVPV
jgi:hypothetical protein